MFSSFTHHKARWLTGIALASVVGLIGWIDSLILTWAVLGLIYLFAFHEAMQLFRIASQSAYFWAAALWVLAYFYPNPDDLFFLTAVVFGSALAYFHNFDKRLILPFLYPTGGMLFLWMLYEDYGVMALFWLLGTVALVDTGAFFVGKAIGKTTFCQTSPNKTWEGVYGGIIIGTLAGTLIGLNLVPIWIALSVTLFTAVSSIFGDLFESYLKREAGVKDSGNILPGHGGVLDRIDGYLFGSVIMLIALRALI